MFRTPVLLITFNRPHYIRQVLEVLKVVKPAYLYIFQDGARDGNLTDNQKCAEVRSVFNEINWPCELKTFFSPTNLGCGKGPSSGISWFFEQVEEGIILEDDCVPEAAFFNYCTELLNYYRDNYKISFIGGTNYIKSKKYKNFSYYFSNGHHGTWGWATWRRTWKQFDYYLNDLTLPEFKKCINYYFSNCRVKEYWYNIFENVKKNRFNESCWDYQFYFSNWKNKQLAIIPNYNLVKNIGSDQDATHTIGNSLLLHQNTSSKSQTFILHPDLIELDKKTDFLFQKKYIQPYNFGFKGLIRIPHRLNHRLKKLLNHKGPWLKK